MKIKHKTKPTIVLRYMEHADVYALFCMENDPQTWQYSSLHQAPYTEPEIEQFVLTAPREIERSGQLRLVIEHHHAVVGAVDLYDYAPSSGVAWVSIIVYPPSLRGRGLALAALGGLIERSQKMGLSELRAQINCDNEASLALFRAAGFDSFDDFSHTEECTAEGSVIVRLDIARHIASHLVLGARGERLAAEYLVDRGFTIIERNWRAPLEDFRFGEIDIVAMRDGALYFVEVKSRSSDCVEGEFSPLASFTARKVERLSVITSHYLSLTGFDGEVFHALICVNIPVGRSVEVRYFPVQF
ncbi:MAG: YraN family protein [Mucinivorans sp.]